MKENIRFYNTAINKNKIIPVKFLNFNKEIKGL